MSTTVKEQLQRTKETLECCRQDRDSLITEKLEYEEKHANEVYELRRQLDEERSGCNKKALDLGIAIERLVNMTAERDALLQALVAAYRTRKP